MPRIIQCSSTIQFVVLVSYSFVFCGWYCTNSQRTWFKLRTKKKRIFFSQCSNRNTWVNSFIFWGVWTARLFLVRIRQQMHHAVHTWWCWFQVVTSLSVDVVAAAVSSDTEMVSSLPIYSLWIELVMVDGEMYNVKVVSHWVKFDVVKFKWDACNMWLLSLASHLISNSLASNK